jgi:hypothetical protein
MESNSIDFLVQEGIINPEVAAKLKSAWVNDVNALYSRVQACLWAEGDSREQLVACQAKELGIQPDKLEGFLAYIRPYADECVANAQKPERRPLGLLIKER